MVERIKELYRKDPLFFYLCAIALALFFLKLYHLAYQSPWLDEGFYILAAKKILNHGYPLYPSGHILFKSILYSYCLAGSSLLTGQSIFAFRLFSLVLHAITPIIVYRIGKKHIPKTILFVAGTLLLFGTWETEYARTTLYYSLVQLLFTLAVILFIRNRLFGEKKTFGPLWVGTCLSHQLGIGLAFAFPAYLLMYPKQFFTRKNLLSLLWWVPFFGLIMLQEVLFWKVGQVYANQDTGTAGGLLHYFFKSFKTVYLELFHRSHPYSFKIFMVGFFILLGLFVFRKYIYKKETDKTTSILTFLSLWLTITLLGLGLMRTHPMPRYLFPFHFIFIIIVVGFIYLILQKISRQQHLKILKRRWALPSLLLLFSYLIILPVSIPKTLSIISRDYTDPVSTDILYTSGRPYPVDHQSLGQYVSRNIRDTDVVVAIHMIFQYLEIGRVNYWLFTGGPGTWDAWEKVNGRWRDFYLGSSWINSLDKLKQVIKKNLAQQKRVWLITSNSEAKRSHIAADIQSFLKINQNLVQWISRDGIGKVYLFSTDPVEKPYTYQAQWGMYKKDQLLTANGKKWIKLERGNSFKSALIFSGPAKKRLFFSFQQKSIQTLLAISTIRLGKIESTRLVGVKDKRIRYMANFRHKGRYALQIKHVKGPPVNLHDINDPANE